jgi:hypothetical protein
MATINEAYNGYASVPTNSTSINKSLTGYSYLPSLIPKFPVCQAGIPYYQEISYVPDSPEPWASLSDVLTASQYVENAIHDTDQISAKTNLILARRWLCYALKYINSAIQNKLNPQDKYLELAGNLQYAINKLDYLTKNTPSGDGLTSYLSHNIYNYQGDLSYLYRQLSALLNDQ